MRFSPQPIFFIEPFLASATGEEKSLAMDRLEVVAAIGLAALSFDFGGVEFGFADVFNSSFSYSESGARLRLDTTAFVRNWHITHAWKQRAWWIRFLEQLPLGPSQQTLKARSAATAMALGEQHAIAFRDRYEPLVVAALREARHESLKEGFLDDPTALFERNAAARRLRDALRQRH